MSIDKGVKVVRESFFAPLKVCHDVNLLGQVDKVNEKVFAGILTLNCRRCRRVALVNKIAYNRYL